MSKRAKIRITSFSIFLLFCLLMNIYVLNRKLSYYVNSTNNNYQHAFSELVTTFGELDTALEKSVYSTSPELLASMCTQVYGKALSAQMALGDLPFSSEQLGETASFISKVGDYSYVVVKTSSSGTIDPAVYDTLSSLASTAKKITEQLRGMYEDMSNEKLTIYDLNSKYSDLSNVEDRAIDDSLLDSFKEMESEFPEVPSLIYDGPFSDDVDTNSYSLIKNENEISEEEALSIAKKITSSDDIKASGTTSGQLEYYTFENDNLRIDISKKGGYLVSMKSYASIENTNINNEDATAKAKEFLDNVGYSDMKSTYYMLQDNTIIINFAYELNGYTCYPDLIKVTVSLDDGTVLGIDASNYLRNHTERSIPNESYGVDDYSSIIGDNLTVTSKGNAVIPTYGKKEVFCHEYVCEDEDENTYIIYIDTQTGKEADILILIESENGFLTI